MIKIKEKISKNVQIVHNIYNNEPENPKTYSSYILLKEYYKNHNIECDEEYDWRYYFIVRRHFLRKKRKENAGHWVCHYCGKTITQIQKRNVNYFNPDAITIDHRFAVSKGGDLLDTNNMLECCYKCNIEKGVEEYESFKLKSENKRVNVLYEKLKEFYDTKIEPASNYAKTIDNNDEALAIFGVGIKLITELFNIMNTPVTKEGIKTFFPDLEEESYNVIFKELNL